MTQHGRHTNWSEPAPSRATRAIPRGHYGHFVGELVFGDAPGRRLGFESLLEYHAALCLIYRQGVIDIEEQIAPIGYRKSNGDLGHHRLDFRVTFANGRRFGVAVKPSHVADTVEFHQEMQAVAAAGVPDVVDQVVVITERHIDPVELANAKLFHAARFVDPDEDAAVTEQAGRLEGPITVARLVSLCGSLASLFAVVRAIRHGLLAMVSHERIDEGTLVQRGFA